MLASVEAILADRRLPVLRSTEFGLTTSGWIAAGSFHASTSSGQIHLGPHRPSEFSGAVANDATRLALAGRETLHAVSTARSSESLHPAWSSIQTYYAAFYYTSAVLRTIGVSQSFFQAREISKLRALLNAIGHTPLPGSGLYRLRFNQQSTQVILSKLDEGSHEALWSDLRNYLMDLRGRISLIGSLTQAELDKAKLELDCINKASVGLNSQPNLSSTRNEVQYRQMLSCWYPNSRRIKLFHKTNRIEQALSEDFNPKILLQGKDGYDDFFTRSLVICGFMHQFLKQAADKSNSGTLGAKYLRYHRSLKF